jgi:hypothetical protein
MTAPPLQVAVAIFRAILARLSLGRRAMARIDARAEVERLGAQVMAVEMFLSSLVSILAMTRTIDPSLVEAIFSHAQTRTSAIASQLGGGFANIHLSRIRDILAGMQAAVEVPE